MLGFRYAGLWLFLVFFTRACVCVLLVRAWIGRKGKEQEERIFWTGRRAGRQTEEEDNLGGSSRGEEAEGLIMPHPCRKGACGGKGECYILSGHGPIDVQFRARGKHETHDERRRAFACAENTTVQYSTVTAHCMWSGMVCHLWFAFSGLPTRLEVSLRPCRGRMEVERNGIKCI